MNQKDILPSQDAVMELLKEIEPGSTFAQVRAIGSEFANSTFAVDARTTFGAHFCVIIKRYADADPDGASKARLEFKTLAMLQEHGVPTPPPLFLDEAGVLFGAPTLVTRYVAGETMLSTPDSLHCARALAQTLAKIHSIPCDGDAQRFLLDGNSTALWFMNAGEMPDYMAGHPDGPAVWNAVQQLLPNLEPEQPALVHMDYWMGNVLWEQGRIVAVLDWEEASYGDPAIDVAYCCMDMYLSGMGEEAARELAAVYEGEMGRPVANLAFWELAAVPRPMHDSDWEAVVHKELRRFIASILPARGQ